MSSKKEGQKNPAFKDSGEELQPQVQGAEGGSPKTSPKRSSAKKWKDAFLKYSPTGKSSKAKSKSDVSPKGESTDIREGSSGSGKTAFQKFAERARKLVSQKTITDLKDNLCENEEQEICEEAKSPKKRLRSIPKQASIDSPVYEPQRFTDSSSVVSLPTTSISLGSSPFSSEPTSPRDEAIASDPDLETEV